LPGVPRTDPGVQFSRTGLFPVAHSIAWPPAQAGRPCCIVAAGCTGCSVILTAHAGIPQGATAPPPSPCARLSSPIRRSFSAKADALRVLRNGRTPPDFTLLLDSLRCLRIPRHSPGRCRGLPRSAHVSPHMPRSWTPTVAQSFNPGVPLTPTGVPAREAVFHRPGRYELPVR